MITEETFGEEPRTQAVVRTRVLRAPRDLVFDALVNPELLARWCGPRDFTQSVCEVDLWSGGTHRQVLRGPEGKELTLSGTYRVVTRPEKLVYIERFEVDPHSSHDHVVDIWLAERGGATTLTLTERIQASRDLEAKMQIGAWEANLRSLDRLAELVDSMRATGPADRSGREWALLPVERGDPVHRPSGTYARAGLGTGEQSNEVQTPERAAGRRGALERFAALFRARP